MHLFYSLRTKNQFDRVNEFGEKIVRRYFVNIFVHDALEKISSSDNFNNKTRTSCGLGLKVKKKIFKSAVTRNKIKRRIKHMVRLVLSEKRLQGLHFAMVIIPRKDFLTESFEVVYNSLKKLIIYQINSQFVKV